MESVHYLMKTVAGRAQHPAAVVLRHRRAGRGAERHRHPPGRPGAVDAVPGPGDRLPARTCRCWRRSAGRRRFPRRSSGASPASRGFPAVLAPSVKDGRLEYFCNTLVSYTLRGIHTTLNVIWDWEPAAGCGRHALRGLPGHPRAGRSAADAGRPLPARALRRAGRRGGRGAGALGGAGKDRGAAARVSRASRWRIAAPRSTSRFPRRSASATRRTSRRSRRTSCGTCANRARAAGVGAAEHARQVLRDDHGHRAEPAGARQGGAAHRAAIGAGAPTAQLPTFQRPTPKVAHPARRFLAGRATSALPRLGPSARDRAPAAFDARCISSSGVAARSHTAGMLAPRALAAERIARLGATRAHRHGLSARKNAPPARALTMPAPAGATPKAGAQSVGRPGDPGGRGESAPARPERLRRIFQTAAVALAALRRQADMARPPRAALSPFALGPPRALE